MSDFAAEQKVSFSEVMSYIGEYLKSNDLVIVPRQRAKEDELKDKFSRKTALSYKQISDAQIWGPIKKAAVEKRVAKYLESGLIQSHEIDKSRHPFKIRRQAFERIAKLEGTL